MLRWQLKNKVEVLIWINHHKNIEALRMIQKVKIRSSAKVSKKTTICRRKRNSLNQIHEKIPCLSKSL
jgi:hypothetical protein